MHVHGNEDEWHYLLDGEVTFHVGEDSYHGKPGRPLGPLPLSLSALR